MMGVGSGERLRGSKGDLDAREDGFLALAQQIIGRAAFEVRLVVVHVRLQVFVQMPVQSEPPGKRLGGRSPGIRINGKDVIIDIQGADAAGNFPRAPTALARAKGAVRCDGLEGILFTREEVRSRYLPSRVSKLSQGAGARSRSGLLHDLLGERVFAEQSKGTPIVIPLRGQPPVRAIGHHVGRRRRSRGSAVTEESLLPDGGIGSRRAIMIAVGPGNP